MAQLFLLSSPFAVVMVNIYFWYSNNESLAFVARSFCIFVCVSLPFSIRELLLAAIDTQYEPVNSDIQDNAHQIK